jgi:hypothetical protein
MLSGFFHPLPRNHAPSAAFLHITSILAWIDDSLPQWGLIAKLSDPSLNFLCRCDACPFLHPENSCDTFMLTSQSGIVES